MHLSYIVSGQSLNKAMFQYQHLSVRCMEQTNTFRTSQREIVRQLWYPVSRSIAELNRNCLSS